MDHNQGRRGHFHRGRRGPDRRGPERRGPDRPPGPPAEQVNRSERADRVDVEQIMREIRGRITQRSGIELSNQQIQELAARRLEAILDPRGLKPELLDQLRRSAGERPVTAGPAATSAKPSYPFDEASLYDSPNGLLRLIRKLLRPFLRMLFNPTAGRLIPLIGEIHFNQLIYCVKITRCQFQSFLKRAARFIVLLLLPKD